MKLRWLLSRQLGKSGGGGWLQLAFDACDADYCRGDCRTKGRLAGKFQRSPLRLRLPLPGSGNLQSPCALKPILAM